MALTNKLVPFDERWKKKFLEEAESLKGVFGDSVIEIHHVGSTAIPGIYAKPEIDVLVVIKGIDTIETFSKAMEANGFRVRGEEVETGRFYYSKDVNGVRTCKVHVCENNHPNVKNQLNFRDYLIAHPEIAKEYSDLKLSLAKSNTRGIVEYIEGKDSFVQKILTISTNVRLDNA